MMPCASTYCYYAQPVIFAGDGGSHIRVKSDGRTVIGSKGYCLIRASRGVSRGSCYVEMRVNHADKTQTINDTAAHLRLGFATRLAQLDGPVGSERHSYSYADKVGNKYHEGRGEAYGPIFGLSALHNRENTIASHLCC